MPTNPWSGRTTQQLYMDAETILHVKRKLADAVHALGRAVSDDHIPYNPEQSCLMLEDVKCDLDGMMNMINEAYGWTAEARAEAQDEHDQWTNMRQTVQGKA